MADVNDEYDVTLPQINSSDEESNDHSLPCVDEVKNFQDFADEKKNKEDGQMLTRKQMYLLGGLLGGLVIVVLAMGIAIAQNNASARNRPSRVTVVVDFLSDNFADRTALEEMDSPQKKAAKWIADEDGFNMPLPASNDYKDAYKFVQRYALAVMYYAWSGEDEWIFSYQFMSDKDECDWNYNYKTADSDDTFQLGVRCNEDLEVDYMYMPGNGLEGTIPGEIGLLLALSHLSLFNNRLEGTIPVQTMYLTDLKFMALESNKLTGTIPDWIGSLSHMKFLALGSNKLTGEVPSALTSMTRLSELSLETNRLSGEVDIFNKIPTLTRLFLGANKFVGQVNHDFLLKLTNLKQLDVSSNKFTGVIPHHLLNCEILDLHDNDLQGDFPNVDRDDYVVKYLLVHDNGIAGKLHNSVANLNSLTRLDVSNNEFTGTIPHRIADMSQLQYLYLANNGFEKGPIPKWHNLTRLHELSLKGTNRVGAIHYWIGEEMQDLTLLSLDNNNLSGEIPDSLGQMKHMEYMLLNQNDLEGTVPTTFKNLKHLKMLRIDNNSLNGNADPVCSAQPEKLDIFTSDCSKSSFKCQCCSNCCDDPNSSCNEATVPENDISWKHGYPKNQAVFSEDIIFEKPGKHRQ